MTNWTVLNNAIRQVIYSNGTRDITGQILQTALLNIVNNVGSLPAFGGTATPSTNPGVHDGPVFYIATAEGLYANFNNIAITKSEVPSVLIRTDGTWTKQVIGTALAADIEALVTSLSTETNRATAAESALQSAITSEVSRAQAKEAELQEAVSKEVSVEASIMTGGYYNTTGVAEGALYTGNRISLNNYASSVVDVTEYNEYQYKGHTSTSMAVLTYVITNSEDRVIAYYHSSASEDYRDNPLRIVMPSGARKMYVNFAQYDSETDGLILSRVNRISETEERVGTSTLTTTAQDLTSAVNELNSKLVQKTDQTIVPVAGGYYNTKTAEEGEVFDKAKTTLSGYGCSLISVQAGDVVFFYGKSSAVAATRTYVVTDSNKVVLSISDEASGDRRTNPIAIPIAQDGYVYINYNEFQDGDRAVVEHTEELSIDSITALSAEVSSLSAASLLGKTIVCFGDSITEFTDAQGKRYSDYIEDLCGCTCINVGIGGTQLRRRANPFNDPLNNSRAYGGLDIVSLIDAVVAEDFTRTEECAEWLKDNTSDDNTAIIERLEAIDWTNVSAITVFAGTNDWKMGQVLGTNNSDIDTTLGAINHIIAEFTAKYKNIPIFWFTPIVRYIANSLAERTTENFSDNWQNAEEKTLAEYVEAIIDTVKRKHIPVCDLYYGLGWGEGNFSEYFNPDDATHPRKGFKQLAEKMAAFLTANKTF